MLNLKCPLPLKIWPWLFYILTLTLTTSKNFKVFFLSTNYLLIIIYSQLIIYSWNVTGLELTRMPQVTMETVVCCLLSCCQWLLNITWYVSVWLVLVIVVCDTENHKENTGQAYTNNDTDQHIAFPLALNIRVLVSRIHTISTSILAQ